MAELTTGKLKIVVVTPEKAVLDESADTATLPMFDGELGVLPGRAALVGQLGPGELRLTSGTTTKRYFVDSGFAQIRADVVTVLTAKAIPAADLTVLKADEAIAQADAMPVTNSVERINRQKAQARAAGMKRVAAKG